MKTINEYLTNKIGDISKYNYQPKNITDLESIIDDRIKKEGPNCDLNDIDVSKINDLSYLFYESKFNGDISNWDVGNVTDMTSMFESSQFDGDLSGWDVGNVACVLGYAT